MARYCIPSRLVLLGFVPFVGAFFSIWAPAFGQSKAQEQLIAARFDQRTDSRGQRWDIQTNGVVGDGTNDCFDNGLVLRVQGSEVSFSQPKMTADGAEYVLTGRRGPLTITRRVRLDPENAALRYLEIFESTSGTAQQLPVTIHTDLGSNAMQVLDSKDKLFIGQFAKDDGAFVAVQSAGSRPGVVFLVTDPKAKTKPVVQIRDNRSIDVNYIVDLPAKGSVALVHYVAQRGNAIPQDARDLLAAYYKRGRLVDRQLPKAYTGAIVNFTTSKAGAPSEDEPTPVLASLHVLVEAAGLTREKADAVVIDAGSKLSGTISGVDFAFTTAYGKTPVAFADVAGITGGAGVQKPIRVFLRTGEILSGTPENAKFAMATDTGLTFDIDLQEIRLLTLRRTPQDGLPPSGTLALVTTHRGDRIALAADVAAELEAATAWGMIRVPLAEVESLDYGREPFPGHRLGLTDGSRFLVMLRGGEWSLTTLRFGPVQLVPQSVRELRLVGGPGRPAAKESAGEEEQDSRPFCMVVGENRLAGVIDLPKLQLVSDTSVTPLDPKQIVELQAEPGEGAGGKGAVNVRLVDGQELRGRITEAVVPIRSGERVWRVPVAHLVSIHAPVPEKPAEGEQ